MWAITSAGRWTCSIAKAIVAVLPEPGDAEKGLEAVAGLDPLGQPVARLGLVGDGLVGGVDLEVGHGFETSGVPGPTGPAPRPYSLPVTK